MDFQILAKKKNISGRKKEIFIFETLKKTFQRLTYCFGVAMDVSLSELRELVMDREAWRAAIHRVTKSRARLSD